ncbi:MAG: RNA methyltransferase [Phycisphaeraceae bacterium]|nr:RNA methyltransferase [Phycisphaeraceae bacterium]
MPPRIEPVHDLADPRLEPYRNLRDRELAQRGGRFLAEGEIVVKRLLAGGGPVESILVAENKLERLAGLVPDTTVIYAGPEELVNGVIGFKFHSGIMACGVRPANPSLEALLPRDPATPATLVVCPQILNHDNLGQLIRIAAAFGADGMLLGERCCDPYWRRCVRVSMGTIFSLPIVRSEDLRRDLEELRGRWGVRLIATVTDADALPLERAERPGGNTYPPAKPGAETPGELDRVGLLLGPEDQGLDRQWVALCDDRVTIRMGRGTDSLNVAVAAAVFLHHFMANIPR